MMACCGGMLLLLLLSLLVSVAPAETRSISRPTCSAVDVSTQQTIGSGVAGQDTVSLLQHGLPSHQPRRQTVSGGSEPGNLGMSANSPKHLDQDAIALMHLSLAATPFKRCLLGQLHPASDDCTGMPCEPKCKVALERTFSTIDGSCCDGLGQGAELERKCREQIVSVIVPALRHKVAAECSSVTDTLHNTASKGTDAEVASSASPGESLAARAKKRRALRLVLETYFSPLSTWRQHPLQAAFFCLKTLLPIAAGLLLLSFCTRYEIDCATQGLDLFGPGKPAEEHLTFSDRFDISRARNAASN